MHVAVLMKFQACYQSDAVLYKSLFLGLLFILSKIYETGAVIGR